MSSLAQNPEVICTELEEGAVLLNMGTRTYYSLNDVGREIWRLVETADSAAKIAAGVCRLFDVDEDAARAAVSPFLDRLREEGLIVERDDPAPRGAGEREEALAAKRKFCEPELIKHDEPLHEVPINPFDPQLPLAE